MSAHDHFSVRLKPDEIERIHDVQADLSTEWRPATISDVLRAVIRAGLEVYEAKRKPGDRQRQSQRAQGRKRRRGT